MSDEAEDLRHDTAYVPAKENPFLTPTENAKAYLSYVASGHVANLQFSSSLPKAIRLVLDELRRSEIREQKRAVGAQEISDLRPKPDALAYADPAGSFECSPAAPSFTGEGLSVLELRVLAAHLATALDNVNNELKRRM